VVHGLLGAVAWGLVGWKAFVALMVVLALIVWFLHTDLGLAMRATGDNPDMIRSFGVNTDSMKLLGLALSNGLVALCGAIVAQYQGFADIGMGIGTIVAGLASVILGEVIVRPRGLAWRLAAALTGSLAYRAAIAAALELGLDPGDLKLATAAVVTTALAVPSLARERLRARAAMRRPGRGLVRSLSGHGILSTGHRRPPLS